MFGQAHRTLRYLLSLGLVAGAAGVSRDGAAQQQGGSTPGGTSPGGTTTTVVTTPRGPDPNAGLPSSSRASSNAGSFSDGFDLVPKTTAATVRGGANSQGVLDSGALRIPGAHVVRRGDTLWDITGYYYRNPWMWPKVWSYNAQIQNPHWIYPGDQVRLRNDGGDDRGSQTLNGGMNRRASVAPETVFLRDEGYLDDERRDVWGQISGSPEDRMLLTEGVVIYLDIKDDHEPKPNQELTIFRTVRSVTRGAVVQILGTVKVEKYDQDRKIARGRIIESLDVIERGANVGPIGRHFDVIPPARNRVDLSAHVLVSVYPRVLHGQNQVIFIDKGSDDGLVPGNRLFVLRRGDPWRASLSGSGDLSDKRIRDTAELAVETETARGTERDAQYPDEIVGELRVLRSREKTSACLLTSSRSEIVAGDLAIARKGY
jgi:hypothetical protein